MNKRLKASYYMCLILFLLELFGCTWVFTGIHFVGTHLELSDNGLKSLKYFTTDSNILMGVIALILVVAIRQVLKGRKDKLAVGYYVLFLVGAVGVTLTMLVTIFFLAPTSSHPVTLFMNSNFFLHLLNPLVSIITFVLFLRTKEIPFRATFPGMLPMGLYAIGYVINAMNHLDNGRIPKKYDWYGFMVMGPKSIFIVLPIIILVTYLIGLALWFCNRLIAGKRKD